MRSLISLFTGSPNDTARAPEQAVSNPYRPLGPNQASGNDSTTVILPRASFGGRTSYVKLTLSDKIPG